MGASVLRVVRSSAELGERTFFDWLLRYQKSNNESKMRLKLLISYCDGISKSLKPDKVQTLPVPFSPLEWCTDQWSGRSAQTWGSPHF